MDAGKAYHQPISYDNVKIGGDEIQLNKRDLSVQKKYGQLKGWALNILGSATKLTDVRGKVTYVKTSDLVDEIACHVNNARHLQTGIRNERPAGGRQDAYIDVTKGWLENKKVAGELGFNSRKMTGDKVNELVNNLLKKLNDDPQFGPHLQKLLTIDEREDAKKAMAKYGQKV